MRDMRNTHRFLVGNPGGKILLGRHTRRWEKNIKMYLREM
jgi:hypothetical protein